MLVHLIDTGPLVSALRMEPDAHTAWARSLVRSLPRPLVTCDAVITEAAYFLGTPRPLLASLSENLLVTRFDLAAAAPRITQLLDQFADRQMDLADACLIVLSEQYEDCKVITIDRDDFMVYRRFSRRPIPAIFPPD